MDIQDLGAIGEFIGSLALVATLFGIYLQVRQHNHQQQADAFEAAFNGFNSYRAAVINTPDIADMLVRSQTDPNILTAPEALRIETLMVQLLFGYSVLDHRIESGDIRSAGFNYRETILNAIFAHPIARRAWRNNRAAFGNMQFAGPADRLVDALERASEA